MDIIVYNSTGTLIHNCIEWRCLNNAVHCTTVIDSKGLVYDIDLLRFQKSNIFQVYPDRLITVHRYRRLFNPITLLNWSERIFTTCKQYDFVAQYLLGYVLGITSKHLADDPNKWTCSEFSYWAFQENGYKVTEIEEVLPMPRLFRFSTEFECIYEGTVRGLRKI